MTAVTEDLDLAEIIGPPACDLDECADDAAFAAWWSEPCCERAGALMLLCQVHADALRRIMARTLAVACKFCGSVRVIERIEPLR